MVGFYFGVGELFLSILLQHQNFGLGRGWNRLGYKSKIQKNMLRVD